MFEMLNLTSLFLSLPSSTSSLKVQSVLNFPITELPRGCGRSALSITRSSGKNQSALMVGRFSVRRLSRHEKHFSVHSSISCSRTQIIVQCFVKHALTSQQLILLSLASLALQVILIIDSTLQEGVGGTKNQFAHLVHDNG